MLHCGAVKHNRRVERTVKTCQPSPMVQTDRPKKTIILETRQGYNPFHYSYKSMY